MTKALVKIAQGKAVVEIARVAMADSANRQLAKIEDAMLTYVETTDWAKAAVAAGSVEILARRQGLGQGVEDHAFSVKTECERHLGLAMAKAEKATGTRDQLRGGRKGKPGGIPRTRQVFTVKSLADQGVNKALANKARKMATLTGSEVNAVVSRDKTLAAVTRDPSSSPWQKGLIVNRESRVRIGVSPDHQTNLGLMYANGLAARGRRG